MYVLCDHWLFPLTSTPYKNCLLMEEYCTDTKIKPAKTNKIII